MNRFIRLLVTCLIGFTNAVVAKDLGNFRTGYVTHDLNFVMADCGIYRFTTNVGVESCLLGKADL